MPNSSLNSRASSPIVMPCRIGIGNWPTNDANAGRSDRPFDRDAADRVGPVADDDADAVPRGGAHAVGHRVDVGVDPRADVLQVDHQHVDVAQHLRRSARGSRCRASRSEPRAARPRRAAFRSCCPAGRIGTRAAGRRARQLDVRIVGQDLGGMAERAVDRRRIGDRGRRAGRRRATVVVEETLDADADRAGGGRRMTWRGLYAALRQMPGEERGAQRVREAVAANTVQVLADRRGRAGGRDSA